MGDRHALDLMQHGCKLARELEQNLPNIVNQHTTLINNCEEIIRVFTQAKERLNSIHQENIPYRFNFQHWFTTPGGYVQPVSKNTVQQHKSRYETGSSSTAEVADVRTEGPPAVGAAGEEVARELGGATPPFSVQRPRRRCEEKEKKTIRVPAPRMGNTEIPPEDGYTWRKYGQKEILGSHYPRAYFRCTHQKLYGCLAKKQVQRLDNDPSTYEVTYRGEHTCHMSSTAPSVPPPQQPLPLSQMVPFLATASQPLPSSSSTLPRPNSWLSMVSNSQGGDGAGPSTPYSKESIDQYSASLVTDLANQMFNPGSSSTDSMDMIFANVDEKWGQGDKDDNDPQQ